MDFNWVDWVFIVIIALSALMSLLRGFVREALSLLAWIVAAIVTWVFSSDLAEQLAYLNVEFLNLYQVRLVIACALLFLPTLVLGALVNYLICRIVKLADSSSMDKFLGMIFGAARGAVLVLVIVGLVNFTSLSQIDWWQESELQGGFSKVAMWTQHTISEFFSS